MASIKCPAPPLALTCTWVVGLDRADDRTCGAGATPTADAGVGVALTTVWACGSTIKKDD